MPVGLLSNDDVWSDRHKAVALYFDRLALAVPAEWPEERINEPRSAVRELTEHGLLSVLTYTSEDHAQAAAPIVEAVTQWPDEIRSAIGFDGYWPRHGLRGGLSEHWYDMRMAEVLHDAGLGYLKTDIDNCTSLRTSTRVAQIYRSRLAEIVASKTRFSLTGVDHAPFPGSIHWGSEMIRDVLIHGHHSGPVRFHESTGTAELALISIRTVLPSDLEALTIPDVAAFRDRNREALTVFQNFITDVECDSALSEVLGHPVEAEAALTHIQAEYDRSVQPAVKSLEKSLRRLGIATVWRAVTLSAAAPVLLAEGVNSLLPSGPAKVVVSGSGVALAAGKLFYDAAIERSTERLTSPVNYLLSLKQQTWVEAFDQHQTAGPLAVSQ